MEWIEKAFRAKAALNGSFYVKCWVFFYGFSHNFFVLSPFWAHELSNRRASCALSNDNKMVNQFSTNLSHGSGQTWSNLVKLVKTLLSSKHGLRLMDFNTFVYFQLVLALIGPPRFACRIPGKILRVKMEL